MENFRNQLEENNVMEVYNDGSQDWSVVEDDGFLHVSRFGLRGCFDLGQDLSRNEFNCQSRSVMSNLGVPSELQSSGLL